MKKFYKYIGTGDGMHIRDYSENRNEYLEKGKVFETESDWLQKALAEHPEAEEVKKAEAKPDEAPSRKNGKS